MAQAGRVEDVAPCFFLVFGKVFSAVLAKKISDFGAFRPIGLLNCNLRNVTDVDAF